MSLSKVYNELKRLKQQQPPPPGSTRLLFYDPAWPDQFLDFYGNPATAPGGKCVILPVKR